MSSSLKRKADQLSKGPPPPSTINQSPVHSGKNNSPSGGPASKKTKNTTIESFFGPPKVVSSSSHAHVESAVNDPAAAVRANGGTGTTTTIAEKDITSAEPTDKEDGKSNMAKPTEQLQLQQQQQLKPATTTTITSSLKAKAPAALPPKSMASIFQTGAPAPSTMEEKPKPKFDKEKWIESLTEEQRELLKLEIETLHDSWLAVLKDDITSKDFMELKRFIKKEIAQGKQIFPKQEDVYSWSRHTPLNTVKAVILGQDPYHNVNQAHGLCFSVLPPTPAPPSLKNIYTCLKRDYPTFTPPPNKGGLLTSWADRGVLLLNTCLTVRAHEANSHSNRGWEKFTQKVIDTVARERKKGVVFLVWGTPAGKRVQKVDKVRHCVLTSVHPSPLSASRGFFDCGHFRKCNEWLRERYGAEGEIEWDLKGEGIGKGGS